MKKSIVAIFLMILVMFSSGCYTKVEEEISVTEVKPITLNVGDKLDYNNTSFEENVDFLVRTDDGVFAIAPGATVIHVGKAKYFLTVNPKENEIHVQTNQKLKIGETTRAICTMSNRPSKTNFSYYSTDESVITVDDYGIVTAVNDGMARVIVTEELTNIKKEVEYLVLTEDEKYYEDMLDVIIKNDSSNIDLSSNKGVFDALINYSEYSLIGVTGNRVFGQIALTPIFGSGIIYKMNVYYTDGTVVEDVKDITRLTDIDHFEYYAITNRHIIDRANVIKIFIGDEYDEINGKLVQYDDKIDLAVVKFDSKYYLPTAKFGNSDNVEKGEFIISIGNGTSKKEFRTHTFGVVSSPKRYVNTDTDGDRVNDWDSEYIQHDASINECDSGGAIINMKGEIIGINSTKISSNTFNNMSFAIPSNLVLNIVESLEKGERPKRATLGVSIVDVSNYQQDKDHFLEIYPFLQIPDDLKYGFYVINIVPGGVCDKAQVQVNDIIISFNGVQVKYSYQIRAELGKFIIGSGAVTQMEVLRNGKLITLDVVF